MIKWNLLGVTTCVEHPNFCFPRGTSVGYMIRVRWDQFNKKKKKKNLVVKRYLRITYFLYYIRLLYFEHFRSASGTSILILQKKSKKEKISFLQNRTC